MGVARCVAVAVASDFGIQRAAPECYRCRRQRSDACVGSIVFAIAAPRLQEGWQQEGCKKEKGWQGEPTPSTDGVLPDVMEEEGHLAEDETMTVDTPEMAKDIKVDNQSLMV